VLDCVCPSSHSAVFSDGTCGDDCVGSVECFDVDSVAGSVSCVSTLIGFCGMRRRRVLTAVLADCTVMASPRRETGVGIPGTSFPPAPSCLDHRGRRREAEADQLLVTKIKKK